MKFRLEIPLNLVTNVDALETSDSEFVHFVEMSKKQTMIIQFRTQHYLHEKQSLYKFHKSINRLLDTCCKPNEFVLIFHIPVAPIEMNELIRDGTILMQSTKDPQIFYECITICAKTISKPDKHWLKWKTLGETFYEVHNESGTVFLCSVVLPVPDIKVVASIYQKQIHLELNCFDTVQEFKIRLILHPQFHHNVIQMHEIQYISINEIEYHNDQEFVSFMENDNIECHTTAKNDNTQELEFVCCLFDNLRFVKNQSAGSVLVLSNSQWSVPNKLQKNFIVKNGTTFSYCRDIILMELNPLSFWFLCESPYLVTSVPLEEDLLRFYSLYDHYNCLSFDAQMILDAPNHKTSTSGTSGTTGDSDTNDEIAQIA